MLEKDSGKERFEVGKRIIAFIGPEGSGKSTMALLLAKDTGKPCLTTGDIIRDYAKNDPGRLGDECRLMQKEKRYLAGDLLLEIMSDRFSNDDATDGFILDGGFRTIEETENFQTTLDKSGRNFPVTVIYLNIPINLCFERLITGENARKRNDDTEEELMGRLENFYTKLVKRINIIRNNPNWNIVEIDASATKEEVYERVCEFLMQNRTSFN